MLNGLEADWESVVFSVSVTDRVIREVRQRVMSLAKYLPFSEPDLSSIEMAVGEGTLNAVRHGSPLGEANCIQVLCERDEHKFSIEITDEGSGFAPSLVPAPIAENLKSSGYGLFLMQGLMDEVTYYPSRNGGTTLRLTKSFTPDGGS